MKSRRFVLAGVLAISAAAGPAFAQDDGLYQDVFDPNSSFIRVLAPGEAFATVDGTEVRNLDEGVSSYVNVMPGTIEVALPSATTSIEVAPSSYYTVVLSETGEPEVLTDEMVNSPSKSDVSFYNLTGNDAVELYVPAAKAVAIEDVAPGLGKSVALKAPLTLDFELRAGGETLASVPAVELKRKAGVSIVLTELDGAYTAVAVPNSYTQ
ncbi:alginate O-acetyltransferase AlgF [Psychromarinibacter sp. S121]|uniref:alginate O-acetyltransferase AlgF n=1 Tax=Psychromarinibacter sp. S121 TaxID=3415127 RepID=UPI003C79815F